MRREFEERLQQAQKLEAVGQLAERLRARFPGLRVLVGSGHAGEEIARSGALGGDTPFRPKPFTPDTLLRAVRDALGPAGDAGFGEGSSTEGTDAS